MADDGEPLGLEDRRIVLMREAAADMAAMEPKERTIGEFERRTAEKAERRQWFGAGFQEQHQRHSAELRAIYQASRFPGRKSKPRAVQGSRGLTQDELCERLALSEAELKKERAEHRTTRQEAREELERVVLHDAAAVVREFVSALGLKRDPTRR